MIGKCKTRRGFTLVEIMIVVLIIGILMAIAIPSFLRARTTTRKNAIVANLREIDAAKDKYAMSAGLTPSAPVTPANLTNSFMDSIWPDNTPVVGTYTVVDVQTPATFTCSSGTGNVDYWTAYAGNL